MELTAYLGTVAGLVALAVAGMRVVVGQLGRQIDALGESLGARMSRLETQNDAIVGAVSDLGQRVAHLEGRRA